ncbi:DUF1572 family protein [Rurimicrobium arvi]|uniref:DUF1572 domain-containing protein n=1 Tax=Rurimicrobium arvi TaxID=2049916 RepID=A0ABP8MTF9_9BACT
MESYLQSITKQFQYYKSLGEKAMDKISDEQFFWQYNAETNSIAIIVNHIAGNMLSRFTDFLNSDGEKPWRNRDAEFEEPTGNRAAVMDRWHQAWALFFDTLGRITEQDLDRIIYIRNDGHTVTEAYNRQLAHYPYHIGQIVHIAKMLASDWESLSIPRNASAGYNARKFAQEKDRRHFTDDL